MEKERIEEVKWFEQNKLLYEALSKKIKYLIKEVLDSENINYYNVDYRVKSIESFKRKINLLSDVNFKEIQDLSGIRIITYFKSDIAPIVKIIRGLFKIDESRSTNKSLFLGTNKMGYHSIHLVASLSPERLILPENNNFKDMFFEIQIRTILQHAWAEMQHDKNYKFAGVLPKEIKRSFSLLAGHLELGDNEFDRILRQIEEYSKEVSTKTKEGDLDIQINSTSLRQYFLEKFKGNPLIEPKFGPEDDMSHQLINELKLMGVTKLNELDEIIPYGLNDKIKELNKDPTNFCGLIRNILIIHDAEKYFSKAWKNSWKGIGNEDIYLSYKLDLEKLDKKYHFRVY